MLEHLFGSKTRLKLLKLFFATPEKSFYVRELTRLLDVQINAVRRELELLLAAKLITESEGEEEKKEPGEIQKAGLNLRKYYRLDTESILYPELKALLLKAQVLGEQKFMDELKEKAGDIKLLLVTGRFTNDERAKTDLLIVGQVDEKVMSKTIEKHEKDFGFEIRYTILTEKEFYDRRQMMDKFLYSLFEANHLRVVDLLKV